MRFETEGRWGLLALVVIALLFSPNVGRLLEVTFQSRSVLAANGNGGLAMTPTSPHPPTVVIPPTETPIATATPTETSVPSPTSTLHPTKTTSTPLPTSTATETFVPTATSTTTLSPTSTMTVTPTPTARVILTVVPTVTGTASPTVTTTAVPPTVTMTTVPPTAVPSIPAYVPETGVASDYVSVDTYRRGLTDGGTMGIAIGLILAGMLAAIWLTVREGGR